MANRFFDIMCNLTDDDFVMMWNHIVPTCQIHRLEDGDYMVFEDSSGIREKGTNPRLLAVREYVDELEDDYAFLTRRR